MTDIEAVKSRLDIVEYISKKVELKPAGRNYKGRCPFHQEKTPSFMVNPDLQIYKCFGCGEGGDILTFIEKTEGLEFGEALRLAADLAGYTLQNNPKDDQAEKRKQEVYKVNQLATDYWHYALTTHVAGKPGRDYATRRGIRKQEIDLFKLGYAPDGANLTQFLIKKGYSHKQLIDWGLSVERKGEVIDKFRSRLMLPIYNLRGQVVGFSGRIIYASDYAPKYINSSETEVYKKSEILMGLFQAKDAARLSKTLILEEGNLDLMASHKVGVANICATGGTAITPQQIKLIKRYAEKVLFCFDTDRAGQAALIKAIGFAEEAGLEHGIIELGKYKDPDELIQAEPAAWGQLVQNPTNSYTYLFRTLAAGLDLGTADGKSRYAKQLLPILKLIKDPVQLNHFSAELAVAVQVSKDTILRQVQGDQTQFGSQSSENQATHSQASEVAQQPVSQPDPAANTVNRESYFLALLAAATSTLPEFRISREVFTGSAHRQIFDALLEQKQTKANFSEIADSLGADAQNALQTILTWDISEQGSDLEAELRKADALLYKDWLQKEILVLRTKLNQEPENEQTLQNLLVLTNELQSLSK